MKTPLKFLTIICIMLCSLAAKGRRISDHNTIGWAGSFNTLQLSKQFSVLLEYQWRRDNMITDWQQSMIRTGLQYQFKNGVSAMFGYGNIITYPYGDYPAGRFTFPEHRIFEQLTWSDDIGRIGLSHRIRLEQRYLGKIDQSAEAYKVTEWIYMNRGRYQLRATLPLNNKRMGDKTFFAAAFDEVFIGFGKNVKQNIFDQNRIGLVLGYQLNRQFRAEAGYFNQTLQQPLEINNNEVFQYNNGIIINIYTRLFN